MLQYKTAQNIDLPKAISEARLAGKFQQTKKTDRQKYPEMDSSKFTSIDHKLKILAEKLNAKLITDGSDYFVNGVRIPGEKIEERRIVWTDGKISKAILIQPHFDTTNENSQTWNFFNLAWVEEDSSGLADKPFWTKYLLRTAELEAIEKNIDELLRLSEEQLGAISRKDLK
jgi:hypothetical protein